MIHGTGTGIGIGIGICAVHRIQAGLARHGERLARRPLADGERPAWRKRSVRWSGRGLRGLAQRKAAFGQSIRPVLARLHGPAPVAEVVLQRPAGQAAITLHGAPRQCGEARGLQGRMGDASDCASNFCMAGKIQTPPRAGA